MIKNATERTETRLPQFVYDWADDAMAEIVRVVINEEERYIISASFDAPQKITAIELVNFALMVTEAWNAEGTENSMYIAKARKEAREWIEDYFTELEMRSAE